MADVDRMRPVHHIVMYWAIDGGSIRDATAGLVEGIASGEYFVIFEPQPVEAVQEAADELLDGGYIELHQWLPDEERYHDCSTDEAHALLRDLPNQQGNAFVELTATEQGMALWDALDERFGHDARKASEVAERRSAEFLERHPDFEERRMKFFEDQHRWVETGEGEMPEFPTYPGEPPPYDDDVPRYDKSQERPADLT